MKHIILPGLTTTPRSNWRKKTEEIDELGLEEIAFFPTFLKIKEREELYHLLKKTNLKRIPHAHLRDDVEEWELDFLRKRYKTEIFNMHPEQKDLEFIKKTKYKNIIYVENLEVLGKKFDDAVKKVAGICFDVSHAEDMAIKKREDKNGEIMKWLRKYRVGCCHVSAIKDIQIVEKNYLTGAYEKFNSNHWMDALSELDYVKKYVKYLPKYVSIELENSFGEQMEAKKYLDKIINGK